MSRGSIRWCTLSSPTISLVQYGVVVVGSVTHGLEHQQGPSYPLSAGPRCQTAMSKPQIQDTPYITQGIRRDECTHKRERMPPQHLRALVDQLMLQQHKKPTRKHNANCRSPESQFRTYLVREMHDRADEPRRHDRQRAEHGGESVHAYVPDFVLSVDVPVG